MKERRITEQQANKIAWETVLCTGNIGAHASTLNSLRRAAGSK